MAYDEGLAQLMRDDLAGRDGITEKKMFGGLAFMLNGNMVCGVHKDGGMFRVGKGNENKAMQIDGAGPMQFTGRKMGGMVDVAEDTLSDDELRNQIVTMALEYARSLPPK